MERMGDGKNGKKVRWTENEEKKEARKTEIAMR